MSDWGGWFGYKISSPAGIIGNVIQLWKKMILIDSLTSVKALLFRKISHRTHPLVYECKQMYSDLLEDEVEVEIMWILGGSRVTRMVLFLKDHFRR
jgi:hypothetical protein